MGSPIRDTDGAAHADGMDHSGDQAMWKAATLVAVNKNGENEQGERTMSSRRGKHPSLVKPSLKVHVLS